MSSGYQVLLEFFCKPCKLVVAIAKEDTEMAKAGGLDGTHDNTPTFLSFIH
jgi:hypothetical protein